MSLVPPALLVSSSLMKEKRMIYVARLATSACCETDINLMSGSLIGRCALFQIDAWGGVVWLLLQSKWVMSYLSTTDSDIDYEESSEAPSDIEPLLGKHSKKSGATGGLGTKPNKKTTKGSSASATAPVASNGSAPKEYCLKNMAAGEGSFICSCPTSYKVWEHSLFTRANYLWTRNSRVCICVSVKAKRSLGITCKLLVNGFVEHYPLWSSEILSEDVNGLTLTAEHALLSVLLL